MLKCSPEKKGVFFGFLVDGGGTVAAARGIPVGGSVMKPLTQDLIFFPGMYTVQVA